MNKIYNRKDHATKYYFEWKKLSKIPPNAFFPPPKIFSRLLYFKPKKIVTPIPNEEQFWKFIKVCFRQPRRTLRNNLVQAQIYLDVIPESYHGLRAQQLCMDDFLKLWDVIKKKV